MSTCFGLIYNEELYKNGSSQITYCLYFVVIWLGLYRSKLCASDS